ncbi:hypothetical protein EYF80_045611 [Liparis tanakae]|uniref:Uncharacterized protein n=1 Tax=Liparis tanakae TaxID=230148 RepID=A0A4Z2FTZ0_9TELE|nr:hypothetical protein EYF80_045611 [Liparis tanakae]
MRTMTTISTTTGKHSMSNEPVEGLPPSEPVAAFILQVSGQRREGSVPRHAQLLSSQCPFETTRRGRLN